MPLKNLRANRSYIRISDYGIDHVIGKMLRNIVDHAKKVSIGCTRLIYKTIAISKTPVQHLIKFMLILLLITKSRPYFMRRSFPPLICLRCF